MSRRPGPRPLSRLLRSPLHPRPKRHLRHRSARPPQGAYVAHSRRRWRHTRKHPPPSRLRRPLLSGHPSQRPLRLLQLPHLPRLLRVPRLQPGVRAALPGAPRRPIRRPPLPSRLLLRPPYRRRDPRSPQAQCDRSPRRKQRPPCPPRRQLLPPLLRRPRLREHSRRALCPLSPPHPRPNREQLRQR